MHHNQENIVYEHNFFDSELLYRLRHVMKEMLLYDHDILSFREIEVCLLMAQGASNIYISKTLNISPRTCQRHTSEIYRKLNLQDNEDIDKRVCTILFTQKLQKAEYEYNQLLNENRPLLTQAENNETPKILHFR